MTAGPIVPRVPVDPGPRTLQKAESDPGRGEEGQSFADLLAAMIAPGAVPGLQSDVAPPETPQAVFDRLDAAEVFNETGLFRGAAPLTAESVTGAGEALASVRTVEAEISAETAHQLARSPSPGTVPAQADSTPGNLPGAAQQFAASGPAAAGRMPPASAAAIRSAASPRGQPVAAPQNPAQEREAPRESAAVGRRAQSAAKLVQAYLARAGSTAAQVSVQAAEGGISLVARADKLSREEKDKLRVEIGGLLARHGLAAANIMLNGEAWPAPQGRNA